MKKIKTLLTIAATVAMLALPVAANNAIVTADAAQDACSDDGKRGLYATFRENLQKDQAKAYDAAKKYLACPAAATPTEGEQKIIDYLKNFVTKYEAVTRKNRLNEILYNEKNYAEAFKVGREVLAGEPENIEALVHLGANGYLVAPLNNPQLVTEAIQYATKSLQMLDGGKTLTDWGPLKSKDVAVAYLNYTIGSLTIEKDPSGALKHLIKSAQFATPLKDSAITYALIAGAYETGPYAKQSDEYKKMYLDKDETPESKLALANINQIVDRMIDAYARAVALAGSNADLAKQKTTWNESLLQWYKFRNKSEAGMNELVASILSKPLPPEPTPLTSLPAAPASTPVGTSGGATPTNATGAGAGNGAAATPNKPATTTAPATAPASANTKPTPKPGKPRR